MPSEIVLFDLHDVLVTNRRFTVHGHSFSLRSIRSLQFVKHGRSWRPTAASASLSLLSGLAAVTTANAALAIPAAGLSLLSAALFFRGAPHYSIALDTEDGYFVPLISHDRFLVEGVAKVLESAARRSGAPLHPHREHAVPISALSARQPRPALVALGTSQRRSHTALPLAHSIRPV
jgi:hypothetical protein